MELPVEIHTATVVLRRTKLCASRGNACMQ